MARPKQEEPMTSMFLSWDEAFGLHCAIVFGLTACVLPFTRKHFGPRAFETSGPVAIGMMIFYWGFGRCPEMGYVLSLWLALLVWDRIVTFVKRWRGWECHSRYEGRIWFVGLGVREFTAKSIEVAVVLTAGILLSLYSQRLGLFVIVGAVSLAMRRSIERGIENAQIQAMRDQELEMQARMARYRNRY